MTVQQPIEANTSSTTRPSEGHHSVAFVGLGPKGLYCLERLVAQLRQTPPQQQVVLHLWDPQPAPGASPPYDLDQPAFLRMNFANRWVDLRPPEEPRLPGEWLALTPWLEKHHPALAAGEGFAPRRVVGEYLHAAFEAVLAALPDRVSLIHHRRRAISVEAKGPSADRRWQIGDESGATVIADEVGDLHRPRFSFRRAC